MRIDIRCSWCGKYMGSKDCGKETGQGHSVSHSICPSCYRAITRDLDVTTGYEEVSYS